MNNILVVEDDKTLNLLEKSILTQNGFVVSSAYDGEEGLNLFCKEKFDLVITDVMMPKKTGTELVEEIRRHDRNTPILIVTAKSELEDKEEGFELGADDYLTKPFEVQELVLRVKALLRRAKISNDKEITVGNTTLKLKELIINENGKISTLPKKEFLLLYKLLSYPNKIFTRNALMDEIWGLQSESYDRTVDVHITKLREHFANNKDFEIITVRGLGYKAVKNEK